VKTMRLMRHKQTSIVVASQDPSSVPSAVLKLQTVAFYLKMSAKEDVEHLQRTNPALEKLVPRKLANLGRGQCYFWALKSSDVAFSNDATLMQARTRVTLHGGATITAAEAAASAKVPT
jgi:DNA phosphorothioation-dependent restriction protein DptH